jgi:hypothetical protein
VVELKVGGMVRWHARLYERGCERTDPYELQLSIKVPPSLRIPTTAALVRRPGRERRGAVAAAADSVGVLQHAQAARVCFLALPSHEVWCPYHKGDERQAL